MKTTSTAAECILGLGLTLQRHHPPTVRSTLSTHTPIHTDTCHRGGPCARGSGTTFQHSPKNQQNGAVRLKNPILPPTFYILLAHWQSTVVHSWCIFHCDTTGTRKQSFHAERKQQQQKDKGKTGSPNQTFAPCHVCRGDTLS